MIRPPGTLLLILAVLTAPGSGVGKSEARPNIIVILADDLGYNDLGIYGRGESPSPELDHLAAKGLTFTDFYAGGPVCSPTRASLLTGKFPSRLGLEGVYRVRTSRTEGMSREEKTLPEILKDAGYATGLLGKWHLGYLPKFSPLEQGFDVFKGFLSGNIDYHSHVDGAGFPDWWNQLALVEEEGYATDLISRNVVQFVETHREQPFFLLVAHGAPHFPFQGREDLAFRVPGKANPSKGVAPAEEWPAIYQEMVRAMDEGVGRFARALDNLGIAENTLIFFFSDNGGLAEVSNHGSLRGWKSSLWEGGIRVPAFMYWKGKIEPGVCREPVSTVDLFSTFSRLAGVAPSALPDQDGMDISPVLSGLSLPGRILLWRFRNQAAARSGPWKLLRDGQSASLFYLPDDLGETNDLSTVYPYIRQNLIAQLERWETELPLPLTNN